MLAEELYMKRHAGRAFHTTWNPGTSDVLRLHMIFPRYVLGRRPPAIVIINGKDFLPLSRYRAILLAEVIEVINARMSVSGSGTYRRLPAEEKVKEGLPVSGGRKAAREGSPVSGGRKEARENDRDSVTSSNRLAEVLQEAFGNVQKCYTGASVVQLAHELETLMGVIEDINSGREPDAELRDMALWDYAPYMPAPHRMDLMVSAMTKDGRWHCNQRCLHCYAAGQEMGQVRELSTGEWKQIIDRCYQAGISQLTFTGGEPTMREDLPELIAYARWFITRLNTNGVRLTEDFCQKLAWAELDNVQITFYSADRHVHNQLVGADRFDETVAGIRNALAAGLGISVNTPLCSVNADYLETLRFLYGLGVRFVTVSGLIVTGNARSIGSRASTLTEKMLTQILKEACDFAYAHDMELNFTSPGLVDSGTLRDLALDVPGCGAALSNMAIAPNGDLVPCQSWLSDRPLGNMLQDPWKKIWNAPRTRQIRRHSAKNSLFCPLSQRDGGGEENC
ncbi:radical SAM domain protein [Shuttleworthella sp. MSX8B]|uniref:radical SAM protein n=1 Tax=Shuttleworthella sp. MSX8B TaxID=936574 RepID=UPI00044F532D|nr:radical SAM protein [Shuttleworthia sp. MSX8B]EUB12944.1 radical SAM domain protein [Shuttleworthia sp. MSX8B]